MFDFIMKHIRRKVKSLEEFVQVVRDEGCGAVLVEPLQDTKGDANTATVGVIADFQYILEYRVTTPRGRTVVYLDRLFERFGSDRGFSDAEDRQIAAIKHYLLAEKKVQELRAKLPDVSLDLIGPKGQPMDEAMYARLHQDAETLGVSV